MPLDSKFSDQHFKPIDDELLISALNELSRSTNILTTYGKNHPVVKEAVEKAEEALKTLFSSRSRLTIGAFNAVLTIDEVPVKATGTLLKSLERRLTNLRITGLTIKKGISHNELIQLIDLFTHKETESFHSQIGTAGLSHISSEDVEFKAVYGSQTVADKSALADAGGNGVLDLESELPGEAAHDSEGISGPHVEQIVAFLKGDIDLDEDDEAREELTKLASDPAALGKMIMESVSVRQSVSDLSGESLGDIILGCLRRTYDGINKQMLLKNSEGQAEMHKALLLLEENLLTRMRDLTGKEDPEMDRQIVQAIREMDENFGFESAALQYMEHREALENKKQELQEFVASHGTDMAEHIIDGANFPHSEWRRIVVDSGKNSNQISEGLSSLTNVFERLESLMKSDDTDAMSVQHLLGQATENLDDTIFTTKEKLDVLSQQLQEDAVGTIGGQGRNMTREDLLASLAEVAQELMQPLTAITASLEMMLHGFVGAVSKEQQDLLNLAANSGEHLKFLMQELIGIVGCPANKGTDPRYHTTSEEVIMMKDAKGQEHLPLNYFQ